MSSLTRAMFIYGSKFRIQFLKSVFSLEVMAWAKIQTENQHKAINKQEGKDGPGSLTWIFLEDHSQFFFFFVAFREEFTRIFLCPHSPEPCLLMDQNFAYSFWKGFPRNIPVKLYQNLTSGFREKDYLRISSCLYTPRSLYSPEPCLWMNQNFTKSFLKTN